MSGDWCILYVKKTSSDFALKLDHNRRGYRFDDEDSVPKQPPQQRDLYR